MILRKASLWAFSAIAVAGMTFFSEASQAAGADEKSLIEGAKLCTRYLPRHERQYGIPEHLLAAIASTESGRFHRGLGLNLPWPWTINVNGRGYFFDTKEEAVAAVTKLKSQGFQSIDVGCMQVNLHHHPTAFASVEQAFDPAYNVGYAASFLKRNFMEEGSWRKATGDYHSRTPSYGTSYSNQVFGAWGRIVSKVADARAGRPVLNNYPQVASSMKVDGKPAVVASRVARHSYQATRMRSIAVKSRENGVLVIRAQKNDDLVMKVDNQSSAKPKAVQLTASASTANDLKSVKTAPVHEAAASRMEHGIKVVNLNERPKGQFEPKAARASTALDSLASPAASARAADNKLFVFDN